MVDQKLVEQVRQMRSQGQQNSQIIDQLQKEGHSSSKIFDALNQSSIGNAGPQGGLPPAPSFDDDATGTPAPSAPPALDMPSMPSPSQATPPTHPSPHQHSAPSFASAPSGMSGMQPTRSSSVSSEEYIEAIIDEKWTELEADVQKIVEWKNRSEQRITQLSQQVVDLKDRFEKLHAALIGKIETYDKNILEVGAEIKAMEKVFSKVLPVFTDNVKQLSDITDKMSRKQSE